MIQIPSWLHSTFKELSNEYSHAQIRAKTKKLWLRQVGEKNRLLSGKYVATWESMSRQATVCRDIATDVATSSSMSRQAAVCRDIDDQCRDKQQYVATSTTSVATRKLCRDKKRCRSQKKPKFDIFDQISSPFHPRTIYILVF